MRWLMLFISLICVGCDSFQHPRAAATPRRNFFEVDRAAAWAGDSVTLSWDTNRVEAVDIEVWGFVSFAVPQVQKIVEYTDLPSAGNQAITMPGSLSAAYLIVDHHVAPEQPPNMTIALQPQFYQPEVRRFIASQTCARPGDEIVVNWDTDPVFPLSLQTEVVIQTPTSTSVDDHDTLNQRFENLSPLGSLTLRIPPYESEVIQMGLNLSYSNNDYTGFVGQISVELGNCD